MTLAARQDLADAYLAAGSFALAESVIRDSLPRAAKQFGPEDSRTVGMIATLGSALLSQQKWAEAQSVLKQCLALRERVQPDDWSMFYARSLLGDCLLGQTKFAEAEPFVVGGYEGMKAREDKIPVLSKHRLREAVERVIRLYKAWGRPEKAAEWTKKISHASPAQVELPADVFAPL